MQVIAPPYGSRGDVLFNAPDELNGELSNLSRTPVTVGGLSYNSPEHFFQAMKFFGTRYSEVVRQAGTPNQAKQAASCVGALQYIRGDWEDVKDAVMVRVLVAKFTQHPKSRETLLATSPQRLVFTRKDNYWGVGRDGKTGLNRLGVLMTTVRDALKKGTIPSTGLCAACGKGDVWVSSISAAVFPYCSPGCRVKLGLPQEVHPIDAAPDATISPTSASPAATSAPDTRSSSPSSMKASHSTIGTVAGRTSPAKLVPAVTTGPAVPSHVSATGRRPSVTSSPRSARGLSPLSRNTPRKSVAGSSALNPAVSTVAKK